MSLVRTLFATSNVVARRNASASFFMVKFSSFFGMVLLVTVKTSNDFFGFGGCLNPALRARGHTSHWKWSVGLIDVAEGAPRRNKS